MANLFDWNALEQKIALVISDHEELNRTKALTALALSEILQVEIDEAIDANTDGSNDRGVDSLYIDDRDGKSEIHIFQTKCVEQFERSKKNFPGSEIDKLISFIVDLTNHDTQALSSANPLLKTRIADALETLTNSNSAIIVHFVGNLLPLVDSEVARMSAAFSRYKAITFALHDLYQAAMILTHED